VILWSITRASAFVAFACYTVAVAWGIFLAGRAFRPAAPQAQFHRFVSSLGLVALATHVATVLLDPVSHLRATALAGVGVRPSVLLGVVALWLACALPLSFSLKKAGVLSQRAWRRFHYSGYAVWCLALVHGLVRGTDSHSPIAVGSYLGAGAVVAGAAYWRWVELSPALKPAPDRE
jgi:methionine sulfoxide reductase heme-binding subunit